jgi:hypothetical protein
MLRICSQSDTLGGKGVGDVIPARDRPPSVGSQSRPRLSKLTIRRRTYAGAQTRPVETTTPEIEVSVTPTAPLPAGRHRFQVVVEDDSENRSVPSEAKVIVRDTQKPIAVLHAAPREVDLARSFQLSARRSSDVAPGRIVKYIWTRVD